MPPETTVAAEQFTCVECRRAWIAETERWRLKVLDDERTREAVLYCPDCHAREFAA